MESPPTKPGQQPYPPVDPKSWSSIDTSGPGGDVPGEHYRDRTGYGELVDYFDRRRRRAIGLIRLEAEQRRHPTMPRRIHVRAGGEGNDAVGRGSPPRRRRPLDAVLEASARAALRRARRAVGPRQGRPISEAWARGAGAPRTPSLVLNTAYTCTRGPSSCQRIDARVWCSSRPAHRCTTGWRENGRRPPRRRADRGGRSRP